METKEHKFANMSVGTLVKNDFRLAQVFKKHKIDFCCGGKISLKEACINKNLNLEAIITELENIWFELKAVDNFDEWSLSDLIDYIVSKHHVYILESFKFLNELVPKIARVHGERHPELWEVLKYYVDLVEELQSHMMKEEKVLFPYIVHLSKVDEKLETFQVPLFGQISNPLQMMYNEHEVAHQILEKIRSLTNQLTPPHDACTTYHVVFQKLEEFESDLYNHIHLENNILFPKALQLESKYILTN